MSKTMKLFKDLVFDTHSNGSGIHAKLDFGNGFIISVVAGERMYSTPRTNLSKVEEYSSFEVSILNENGDFVTDKFSNSDDNVLGWIEREKINMLMLLVQSEGL